MEGEDKTQAETKKNDDDPQLPFFFSFFFINFTWET